MLCFSLITGVLWALILPFISKTPSLDKAIAALKPLLSPDAVLTFPNDPHWYGFQIRSASPRIAPNYSVVIEVAVEKDVQAVVRIANKYKVPFLAVTGAHGGTTSLNKLPFGFQINLRKLNQLEMINYGTARVGGGIMQWQTTRALLAQKKYAVTGLCECVSVAGPLLGGGHSLYQAQHGFAVDSLISARVVTSTGELVEVSQTQNADLFWALRGAGHNFGIVTSLDIKIYDIQSNWTVWQMVFTSDKLEALFSLVNSIEEPDTDRPTGLVMAGIASRIPAVDAKNAVITYIVAYEGGEADSAPHVAPFLALSPTSFTLSTEVNHVDVYTVIGLNLESQICKPNENLLITGASLPSWDLEGLREAFTVFGDVSLDPRFANSVLLLENYGMKGVRAIDPKDTSLSPQERENPILVSPSLWWKGDDEGTAREAREYVEKIKNAFYKGVDRYGGKRHSYVNYASGTESKEEMYGYDGRLDTLRKLKKKWDPKNRFRFYNPIV